MKCEQEKTWEEEWRKKSKCKDIREKQMEIE